MIEIIVTVALAVCGGMSTLYYTRLDRYLALMPVICAVGMAYVLGTAVWYSAMDIVQGQLLATFNPRDWARIISTIATCRPRLDIFGVVVAAFFYLVTLPYILGEPKNPHRDAG